jgi:hypothetical protein
VGGRIGAGDGFFDLSCGLLHELGGLRQGAETMTLVRENQVSPELLPQDKWDIQMNRAITSDRVIQFNEAEQHLQIFWDMLSMDTIKRIDPLWKLYGKGFEESKDLSKKSEKNSDNS